MFHPETSFGHLFPYPKNMVVVVALILVSIDSLT